ncbi:class I SAM-dependent methyltransferase [Micromonospora sp. WMMD1082]|uniref:class I SAM-dependent methyltransferase n=1 Tax=Micromonospora sp. WMMD1082 TaxID=3016104 RepID=UPI002415A59C|nr:class I SAM-dependent methyltransferase [Micromonospora sp. WMMD1082]MDG4798772.1 class I SAM-dependent methyltransferase [Micromonospora sp. WMMD1082]
MLAWSDQRDGAGNGPLAALAAHLVPDGARVLLAGPHDPALLDALAHARLTCLLRGYPDAAAIAGRVDRVLVAGPHGLPPGEEYDVVIAGAGLDAVESVEGARLGWDGLLARLVAAVRPGGDLLLRVDNPLGVHRLVAASGWYAGRGDAEWTVGGVLDAARPANLEQARARLAAVGMRAGTGYAAYPRPELTTALLAVDQLSRRTTSGLFDAVLHDACTEGFTGQFVLADPARLAVDALHAGRAADLAPSWLVHARRPAATEVADDMPTTGSPVTGPSATAGVAGDPAAGDALPVALVRAGGPGSDVVEVRDGPQGWHWHRTDGDRRTGPVPAPYASREAAYRDPEAPHGPVPDGRLLRSLLLDGCLRRDTVLLRRLLRGYADWLAGQAEQGRLTGAVALAGADNLVVAGDRYAVLDPTWRADAPLPVDVVLARTLWRFATELLTGGYAHPWVSTLDVAGLTVVLGGVAGRDFDREVVDAAVETEAAVGAARRGLDAAGRIDLDTELRAVTPTDPPPGPHSYQQLREAWRRQRDENTRLSALLKWTEDLLTSRERALRRAEAKINLLSGSLSYKVGRLAITPARMASRGARAAKRRARAAITARRQEHPKQEDRT